MGSRIDTADTFVHTPAEMVKEYHAWAKHNWEHPGITWGIPSVDRVVIPMRPGDLTCLVARPGHLKTSLLIHLAKTEAANIVARNMVGQECVVYVTWEETSESLTSTLLAPADGRYTSSDVAWGRVNPDDVLRDAIPGVRLPIWIVGHGIGRISQQSVRMTPEVVLAAIESMAADFDGIKPTLLLFDYLQLVPSAHHSERVARVTEMPILIKELAMRVGVPACCAVQAGRETDRRKLPIPEESDAQWASSIEQTADKLLALWRPAKTCDLNDTIQLGGRHYNVTENLLIMRLLKQRKGTGRHTWALHFDPALLTLAELETNVEPLGWPGDPGRED